MVNTGNMLWVAIFGYVLVMAVILILTRAFFDGRKHTRILFAVIILVCTGLLIFGLSLQEISRIQNLGRPMSFKLLKDGSGYEAMGAIGKFTIIGFGKDGKGEVRTIFDFPKKLEIGSKFSKQGDKIIEEVPMPKELPKISF